MPVKPVIKCLFEAEVNKANKKAHFTPVQVLVLMVLGALTIALIGATGNLVGRYMDHATTVAVLATSASVSGVALIVLLTCSYVIHKKHKEGRRELREYVRLPIAHQRVSERLLDSTLAKQREAIALFAPEDFETHLEYLKLQAPIIGRKLNELAPDSDEHQKYARWQMQLPGLRMELMYRAPIETEIEHPEGKQRADFMTRWGGYVPEDGMGGHQNRVVFSGEERVSIYLEQWRNKKETLTNAEADLLIRRMHADMQSHHHRPQTAEGKKTQRNLYYNLSHTQPHGCKVSPECFLHYYSIEMAPQPLDAKILLPGFQARKWREILANKPAEQREDFAKKLISVAMSYAGPEKGSDTWVAYQEIAAMARGYVSEEYYMQHVEGLSPYEMLDKLEGEKKRAYFNSLNKLEQQEILENLINDKKPLEFRMASYRAMSEEGLISFVGRLDVSKKSHRKEIGEIAEFFKERLGKARLGTIAKIQEVLTPKPVVGAPAGAKKPEVSSALVLLSGILMNQALDDVEDKVLTALASCYVHVPRAHRELFFRQCMEHGKLGDSRLQLGKKKPPRSTMMLDGEKVSNYGHFSALRAKLLKQESDAKAARAKK